MIGKGAETSQLGLNTVDTLTPCVQRQMAASIYVSHFYGFHIFFIVVSQSFTDKVDIRFKDGGTFLIYCAARKFTPSGTNRLCYVKVVKAVYCGPLYLNGIMLRYLTVVSIELPVQTARGHQPDAGEGEQQREIHQQAAGASDPGVPHHSGQTQRGRTLE